MEVNRIHYPDPAKEVKKIKDAPSLSGDKKAALEEFLKTRDDKKASMDDRMIAFVTYLNSLLIPLITFSGFFLCLLFGLSFLKQTA